MPDIPGPIVSFRWQVGNIKTAIDDSARQIQTKLNATGKNTAQTFASEWQKAAVQLRASLATENLGLNQINKMRENIVATATKELSVQRQKIELGNLDARQQRAALASLKSATLEIERQKSALSGTGGLTTGTRSVVQQLLQGISARAGSYGGGMGSFAGLRLTEPIGKMTEEAGGAHLALLGVGTAALAAGAALATMAIKGAHFAVEMENVAQKAHISIKSTMELRSAADALGVEFDPIIGGFRKFNKEITLAMGASLPHASIEAKRAAEIFNILGIDVKKAALDPMEGLKQLSSGLSKLQEGAVKGAVETELFGRGAQALAPVLNKLGGALDDTKKTSDALASKITAAAAAGLTLETQTANLSNQWHILSVTMGGTLIPVITKTISWLNRIDAYGSRNSGKPFFGGASSGGAHLGSMNSVLDEASRKYGPSDSESVRLAAAMSQDTLGGGRGKKGSYEGNTLHSLLTKDIESLKRYEKEKSDIWKRELHERLTIDEREAQSMKSAARKASEAWKSEMHDRITLDERALRASEESARKIAEAQTRAADKVKEAWQRQFNAAGGIFDAILSGNRGVGDMLASHLEEIILKPLKDSFSSAMATMFQGLSGNVNSAAGSGPAKGIGGVFGKIFGGIDKFLGLSGNSVQLQTQNVTAGVVNIGGAGIGGALGAGNGQGGIGGLPGVISNLTSMGGAGIGGISLALAAAGGMAIAGSGGAAVAGGGGMAAIGALPLSAPGTGYGQLPLASSIKVWSLIGSALPGGAILGAGLHNSNPVAIAMGAGQMGQGVLNALGTMKGGNIGAALKTAGSIVGGIGEIVAGSQQGGVGGALMGAMGGAEIGTAILPGIGTAIGAIAGGLISGIFGGGSAAMHAQHWQTAVTHAMATQQVILPPSESFQFAAGNSMASTFGHTFSGSNGQFSTAGLPGNTPFGAMSILGYPKTGGQLTAFQQALLGVPTSLPFFGAPTAGLGPQGVYQGQNLPPGTRAASTGTVNIHFNLPGFIDKNSADEFVRQVTPQLHAVASHAVASHSSGMRTAVVRANNMP